MASNNHSSSSKGVNTLGDSNSAPSALHQPREARARQYSCRDAFIFGTFCIIETLQCTLACFSRNPRNPCASLALYRRLPRQQIKQSPAFQLASHRPYGKEMHLQTYYKQQQAPRPQSAELRQAPNAKPHRPRRQRKGNAAALHAMCKLPKTTATELEQQQQQHQQASESSPIPA